MILKEVPDIGLLALKVAVPKGILLCGEFVISMKCCCNQEGLCLESAYLWVRPVSPNANYSL